MKRITIMKIISRSDEILLLAILLLEENAYGVSIRQQVYEKSGKKLAFGSLWVSLDILFQKGLIEKKMTGPTPKRGGKSKIHYSLTPAGLDALRRARDFQKSLWKGASSLVEGLERPS